jgi:hypothetical protein
MPRAAKASSRIVDHGSRAQLGGVAVGSRARLLDGSIVLGAALINGAVFVRDNDGVGDGPYELPRSTPVLEVMAPEMVARVGGEVKDPLAGGK